MPWHCSSSWGKVSFSLLVFSNHLGGTPSLMLSSYTASKHTQIPAGSLNWFHLVLWVHNDTRSASTPCSSTCSRHVQARGKSRLPIFPPSQGAHKTEAKSLPAGTGLSPVRRGLRAEELGLLQDWWLDRKEKRGEGWFSGGEGTDPLGIRV